MNIYVSNLSFNIQDEDLKEFFTPYGEVSSAKIINDRETGRFRTNDMIFGIVPFLVELTKYFTLWPGDVIWMGTDGASPDIKHGDVVEIDITGIGTLRNRFVREAR